MLQELRNHEKKNVYLNNGFKNILKFLSKYNTLLKFLIDTFAGFIAAAMISEFMVVFFVDVPLKFDNRKIIFL